MDLDMEYPYDTMLAIHNTKDLSNDTVSQWYVAMEEMRLTFISSNGLPDDAFELIPYSC